MTIEKLNTTKQWYQCLATINGATASGFGYNATEAMLSCVRDIELILSLNENKCIACDSKMPVDNFYCEQCGYDQGN